MKNFLGKSALGVLFVGMSYVSFSQNVAINSSGNQANSASILDLSDASNNTKGLLLPNVDILDVNAPSPIASPPAGLIVWNTNTPNATTGGFGAGFYYWSGSSWLYLNNTGNLTATNGLNVSGNSVQLGGSLSATTTINQSGYVFDISGGDISLNDGTSTSAVNIATGSVGGNAVTIGNSNGATSINEKVGTGNYTLNGAAGSTYTIGSSTVGGTVTIGGTSQTGDITVGQSTASNAINIGNAATANGSTETVNIAAGGGSGTGDINIGGGAFKTTNTGTTTIESGTGGIVLQVAGATLSAPVSVGAANSQTALLVLTIPANAVVTAGQTFECKLYGVATGAKAVTFQVWAGNNATMAAGDNVVWTSEASTNTNNDWGGLDVLVTLQSPTTVQGGGMAWADNAVLGSGALKTAQTIAPTSNWYIIISASSTGAGSWKAVTGSITLLH